MQVSQSDVEFLFNAAVGFHRDGNLQRASELYERIQSIKPCHVMSLNNQALIARALGRLDLSLRMLEKAYQQEPDNFEVLANLGRVSLQNNESVRAEIYLRQALDIRSRDINLGISLGKALHRQGKNSEAENILLKLLVDNSKNFELLFTLGLIAAAQGGSRARKYFTRAGTVNPNDPGVREQLEKLGN